VAFILSNSILAEMVEHYMLDAIEEAFYYKNNNQGRHNITFQQSLGMCW
jgi:hypothetical protein